MHVRTATWTLALGIGFALTAPVTAQDKDIPDKPTPLFEEVNKHRRENVQDVSRAKRAFAQFAEYHAKLISSPALYRAPQDFRPDPKVPTLDKIVEEFTARIAVPELGGKVGAESVVYIRELGAALDAALVKVIDNAELDPIARVNAARLLSIAARSGAPAHWPTVTRLVADKKLPPEVRFYAFKAAEALLAAYDPVASIIDQQTREWKFQSRKHAAPNDVVIALVKELDQAVTNPTLLLSSLPEKSTAITAVPADQLPVVLYIRRQAVRSLGQCRYPSILGQNNVEVFPAYTLARITLGDPALVPAPYIPRPAPAGLTKKEDVTAWLDNENGLRRAAAGRRAAEAAEATLGLCNMGPQPGYNLDAAAEAVAAGLITFSAPRIGDPLDRSIPFRTYAARLDEALKQWQRVCTPGYDPMKWDKPVGRPAPDPVQKVVSAATRTGGLLPEMERVGPDGRAEGSPQAGDLITFRSEWAKAPNRSTHMFQDALATVMDIKPAAAPAPPKGKK